MPRGKVLTPERRALMDQLVADGWPLIEMQRTHGLHYQTVRKHYPDYRGLDLKEASALGIQARRANAAVRRKFTPTQGTGHAKVENP